jgi:hypothetical protein
LSLTISEYKYCHPNAQIRLERAAQKPDLAPKRSRLLPTTQKKHATRAATKDPISTETPEPALRSPIRRRFSTQEIDSTLHLASPLSPVTENNVLSLAPQSPPTLQPAIFPTSTIRTQADLPHPTRPATPTVPSIPHNSLTNTSQTPALAMSNTPKGISAIPAPTSNKAPSFNGEMSELLDFFELFEDLAQACGLTSADQCKLIVRYVEPSTKHFWVTLTGYESREFTVFKDSILEQYPGAEKGLHYFIRHLKRIVLNSAENDISTETELLQYYRQFRPVAHWLINNGTITP